MANILKKNTRGTAPLLKKIIGAALLSSCAFAQAGVLNFEQEQDSTFIFGGAVTQFGSYYVESYDGVNLGGLAAAIIDGSDSGICDGLSCPVNNPTKYYAGLDDGYFYFGLNSDATFNLLSLQASFIGAGQATFPAVSGILVLQGYNALNALVGAAQQVPLAGPTGGQFNFVTYTPSAAYQALEFSYVRVLGYACDTSGSCSRATGLANFGIDNIVTFSADDLPPAPVPEPASWALLGLGLLGFGLSRRRSV